MLLSASMDLILELGHSLSHANDYISGTMIIHSHKIGNEILSHEHNIISKIEKAIEDSCNNNSNKPQQTVELFNFDQLKLIFETPIKLNNESRLADYAFYYHLRHDHPHNRITSPPPQHEIA